MSNDELKEEIVSIRKAVDNISLKLDQAIDILNTFTVFLYEDTEEQNIAYDDDDDDDDDVEIWEDGDNNYWQSNDD